MKKWFTVGVMLIVGMGCQKEFVQNTSVSEKDGHTVTDQIGRKIVIPQGEKNIVSGFTYPYVSAWYVATGSGKEIVGMHPSSYSAMEYSVLAKLSPDLLRANTNFVHQGEMNIEELLKLQPDIYMENFAFGKNIEKAEEVGITTVALKTMTQADGDPFATMQSWLDLTSDIMDSNLRGEQFAKLSQEAQEQIYAVVASIPQEQKPRVLMIHSHDERSIMVYGAKIWGNYWITRTGGIDVAGEDVIATQEVNMEQIYRWNPDIIIISNFTETSPMALLNNSIPGQDWSVVNAVQKGAVYKIPLGVYRWSTPSGDAPLMLKWMAQTLHPSYFNYNMVEEIREYYQSFYNYSLTEEDVEHILYPASESARSELTLYIDRILKK